MDITRGDFEDFGSRSSSRTQRTDTRSSLRSETTCSLEILPPEAEETCENLFMSEELSEDEDLLNDDTDVDENFYNLNEKHFMSTVAKLNNETETDSVCTARSEKSNFSEESCSSAASSFAESIGDPKLRELMEKMKKYDRILLKKMKREKEVKRQRLIFQKQMLEELTSSSEKNEATANMNKYLALMPPSGQLQEMLDHLETDEFVPIFPTQVNLGERGIKSARSHSASQIDDIYTTESDDVMHDKHRSKSAKAAKKIDFIKRNIELAKDAGNCISMTDDEKKRLNELLSDIDSLEIDQLDSERNAFTDPALMAGEGYVPDEFEMRRLAEIDERIQALLPPDEFEMICGTPHLSSIKNSLEMPEIGRKIYKENQEHANERIEMIQQRLENIDEEWKNLYEGRTPRLTDEQLQKLLDECSITSSRMSSSLSQSLVSNLSVSQNSWRPPSQTSISTYNTEHMSEYDVSDVDSQYSVAARPLSRSTLDRLLMEAKSCLGLSDVEKSYNEDDSEWNDHDGKVSLFETVNRTLLSERHHDNEVMLEELDQSSSTDFE